VAFSAGGDGGGDRLIDAMARAVPTDVVKGIVGDHYKRAAPTPPAPKSIVDQLVEKFGPPKAD
jgi:hypothetical protein